MAARILICDELEEIALERFRARGFEPEVRTGLGEAALRDAAAGVDALVVRSATQVTRSVIEGALALRVIGRAGVGVDNVDCTAASERGVVVMNTPTGNTTTTAELAIALLLSLARHVPRADRQVRAGNWKKSGLVGTEITGKTLGIVGLGRIGRVVAERARGLSMHVVASDPFLQGEVSPVPGVELVPLDELLAQSDFVTLHVPLLDATKNLISRERLARMKRGARLVNAARGGLVDELALAEALASGQLAGAALDVFAQEPPPPDHPLLGRSDVILTPHLGASSREAQLAVARDIADQVADFLESGVARNAVNAPALPAEALAELAPFMRLAERMGAFLAQRLDTPVRKLELTISGEIARHDAAPLVLSLLVGVLRVAQPTGVNFVNAPLLAKERGIRVLDGVQEEAWYSGGQLEARASSKDGAESHLVAGTVFGREPRIVRIDGVHLDLPTDGELLMTRHRDAPGMLGRIGTLLGERGVNIRRLELGPMMGTDLALGCLTLDQAPEGGTLAAIAGIAGVVEVRLVRLGPRGPGAGDLG